jgi:uncharacterized protein involved in exopolysaccharide biosynthesis
VLLLGAFLAIGILACLLFPRSYQSSGMIQVTKDGADALGIQNAINGSNAVGPEDSLSATITLETQADILRSDAIALQVIKDLKLEDNKDFKPKFDPIGMVLSVISPSSAADPGNASDLADQPAKRTHLLQVFSKHLKVALVPGTRLIKISYTNSSPATAAAVVNDIIKSLDNLDFHNRRETSEKAASWVEDQMNGLRQQTVNLQEQVASMQKSSGIYSIGSTDPTGHAQEYSEVLDRLQQITGQLTQAEQSRILKGAVAVAAKSGDGETLSGLAGNSISSGLAPNTANSLNLIQTLRTQEATLMSQIQQDQVKFGSAYPKLAEEQGSLEGVRKAIHDESARLAERAQTDYLIAQRTESDLRHEYEAEKAKADTLNDKAIKYVIAREEAADSRSLYEDLQKRLREAGIAAGLRSTSISVVDPALVPSLPKWPNVPIFLGAAITLGMFLGTFGAIVLDLLDAHVKDPEELETLGPLLGMVPEYKPAHDASMFWTALQSGESRFLNSVQNVCYGLSSQSGEAPGTILICSALPQEGKTVFSIALANCYAQQGMNVLLVETNLKVPRLATFTRLQPSMGLSTMLAGKPGAEYSILPDVPNLSLIPAGDLKIRASEHLGSTRMRELTESWRKKFDVVILDGPAVLENSAGLSLCSMSDHIVQVTRHRKTSVTAVRRAVTLLMRSHRTPVSLVLTDVKENSFEFKSYYGFDPCRQPQKGMVYEEA